MINTAFVTRIVQSMLVLSMPAILLSQGRITAIQCTAVADTVQIVFVATDTIREYHRPEVTAGKAIVRFPNMQFADTARLSGCKGVTVSTTQIRTFAVARCDVGSFEAVSIKRSGPFRVIVQFTGTSVQTHAVAGTTTAPPRQTAAWELDVVVLDPGHGGKDVVAKGVNGVYEKDVTLSIAKQLRDLIQKELPKTKVVMTRDDDTFIELYKRTQIANEARGKLFVSIHCNSMPTIPNPAHGCETYILRPGRNADAAGVAERENASIQLEQNTGKYSQLDADRLIVATMAQHSFVRFSEEFASLLQRNVSAKTGLHNRGVNQAGFYVLVGASMPNVLFETAFLSNPSDAEYISSAKGQQQLAQAMLTAITSYANFYRKSIDKTH